MPVPCCGPATVANPASWPENLHQQVEETMAILHWSLIGCLCAYIAVCFGKIAARNGRNPLLYGLLSVISPVNLIILGIWAFSGADKEKSGKGRPI
jgi:hypothetical protein